MQQAKIQSNKDYQDSIKKLEELSKELDGNFDFSSKGFDEYNELHDEVINYENENDIYVKR